MGQEQRYIIDRVGEETNLEECSLCFAASCFACVSEHCTALKKLAVGGCVFYKDAKEDLREIRKCFYRLIQNERFDLLMKYADTLAALGLMDHEIAMAEKEHERLDKHRMEHLKGLEDQNWKDSLIVIYPVDEVEEPDTEQEPDDSGTDPAEPEAVFDNGMDTVEIPVGMTDADIDDETSDEIQTRDHIFLEDVKEENFHMYEILHEANERLAMETGEDDLPEDYGDYDDDEELETDENGNLLSPDELMEREIEKERQIEAEEEKRSQLIQEAHSKIADGEEAYVSLPLNYFYKSVGFPVHRKHPMDPIVLACGNLGANIVYQAAEDYITTLRMLWSGEYRGTAFHRLVVRKWQLETYMGSRRKDHGQTEEE